MSLNQTATEVPITLFGGGGNLEPSGEKKELEITGLTFNGEKVNFHYPDGVYTPFPYFGTESDLKGTLENISNGRFNNMRTLHQAIFDAPSEIVPETIASDFQPFSTALRNSIFLTVFDIIRQNDDRLEVTEDQSTALQVLREQALGVVNANLDIWHHADILKFEATLLQRLGREIAQQYVNALLAQNKQE